MRLNYNTGRGYGTVDYSGLLKKINSGDLKYCHSPTQPQHELELDLIMGRNPPPTCFNLNYRKIEDA